MGVCFPKTCLENALIVVLKNQLNKTLAMEIKAVV